MKKKASVDKIVNYWVGAAAILLIGYIFISYRYFTEVPTGCIANYPNAMRFALEGSDGLPLSMIELQALAGSQEQGLMQNTRIVNADNGPAPRVLQVSLGRADSDSDAAVGVHFSWRPDGGQDARSGCIRYSVKLPADFDFSAAGVLPGIFGGPSPDRTGLTSEQSLLVRPVWSKKGEAIIMALAKPVSDRGSLALNRHKPIKMQAGQWMTIEQEVTLNNPGSADGTVRVWIDGNQAVDAKGLKLREDDTLGIDGADNTIGYSGKAAETPIGGAQLWITPIDYGWK